MKNWITQSVIIIVLCLQISACSLFGPVKTPPINIYTLSAKNSTPVISQRRAQVLLIAAPTAIPGYQDTHMIYTLRPYELKSFSYNRWTAPPADMLATLLSQNLQNSGCFRAVVSPPFTGDSDLTLDTRLLNLQQEFSGETSRVRMALQLTLSNNKTHQVITNQRVEAIVPVAVNNPYAGVIAANTAADIVLHKARHIVCRQY